AAGEVRLGVGELALSDAISLEAPELVDDQPQHFTGRLRARVRLRLDVAAPLERVEARLRAVGQPTLGALHLMQAIAAFAAEDPDGQVQRHVVRALARAADVADAQLRPP